MAYKLCIEAVCKTLFTPSLNGPFLLVLPGLGPLTGAFLGHRIFLSFFFSFLFWDESPD